MNEEVKGKMEDCHTDSELLTQFHKNTPQLRFSGFDDEWEEKEFGSIQQNSELSVSEISLTMIFPMKKT